MAAGEAMPARRKWVGWISPVLSTSVALFVVAAVLAPLGRGRDRRQKCLARVAKSSGPSPLPGPAQHPGSHLVEGRRLRPNQLSGLPPTRGILARSGGLWPRADPGRRSDHEVAFFPGAWGEFEWECVELSMRWMYLAWGVNPYPADGWDVVLDYNLPSYKAKYNPNGPQLVAVNNGTIGAVPQPGDVVSVARSQAEPYGHTDVVVSNAIDPEGNGTITVIQQNGGPGNNGWATYPVNNWLVGDGVSGWLHDPAWTVQRPVIGFSGPSGFTARIAAPGNVYQLLTPAVASIAVAGDAGTTGTNGNAIYGYIDPDGNFWFGELVRRAGPLSPEVPSRLRSHFPLGEHRFSAI